MATVELSADTTFGSSKLVCPVSEVTFTCTAVGVSSLEWSRNGNLLTSFLPTSSEGIVNDVRIPDGFEIELNRLVREGTTAFANFTTTLTANVSVLMNGSDQISCVSLDIIRTIDILYDRERCEFYALHDNFMYLDSEVDTEWFNNHLIIICMGVYIHVYNFKNG